MLSHLSPASGRILISEPFMSDTNFRRSVVLMADYQAMGAMGFVLNQPSHYLLSDLIPDLWQADFRVFVGGPVEVDTIHFVHRCYHKMLSGEEIGNGIFWGGNFETLKLLVNQNAIGADEIKFFLGYSGWGEGQLEAELEENTWMVSDRVGADTVFDCDVQKLWSDVVLDLGPRYAHIRNFPTDPRLN